MTLAATIQHLERVQARSPLRISSIAPDFNGCWFEIGGRRQDVLVDSELLIFPGGSWTPVSHMASSGISVPLRAQLSKLFETLNNDQFTRKILLRSTFYSKSLNSGPNGADRVLSKASFPWDSHTLLMGYDILNHNKKIETWQIPRGRGAPFPSLLRAGQLAGHDIWHLPYVINRSKPDHACILFNICIV